MKVGSFQVTYCTNVHPGETLDDLHHILTADVRAVKKRLAATQSFGAGLRLGNQVTNELLDTSGALDALVERCHSEDFSVFTVNGFPYGDFAADTIKADVYKPAWYREDRVRYTERLARVLAALPGPAHRTISTVAGGFLPDTADEAMKTLIARNLRRSAEDLARIADETGVHIRLCLEPEPWTMLETTRDAVEFFESYLPVSFPHVREHLGLCYDCCHQAVHFEDAGASIAELVDAGIEIGKVQVSSALHLDQPGIKENRNALSRFAEPRFLHQVVAQRNGKIFKCLDLPQLENPPAEFLDADAWRCHFHVPIWWEGNGVLGTTKADWQAAIQAVMEQGITPHLEIETYTWHVLPETDRVGMESGDLTASIEAEYDALIAELMPESIG